MRRHNLNLFCIVAVLCPALAHAQVDYGPVEIGPGGADYGTPATAVEPVQVEFVEMRPGDAVFRQAERLLENGETALARAQFEESARLYGELGYAEGEGKARRAIADITREKDEAAAAPLYEKAAALFAQAGDYGEQAECLHRQGRCTETTDLVAARALYVQAAESHRRDGDVSGEARDTWDQARTWQPDLAEDGNWLRAEALYAQARQLYRQVNKTLQEALCYRAEGRCFLQAKAYASALECYNKAAGLLVDYRAEKYMPEIYYGQAVSAQKLDRKSEAAPAFAAAAAVFAAQGETNLEAVCISGQADCVASTNLTGAATLYERAATLYGQLGDQEKQVAALVSMGNAWRKDRNPAGNWMRASEAFKQATELLDAMKERQRAADALYQQALCMWHASWFRRSAARVLFLRASKRFRALGDRPRAEECDKWYKDGK